VQYRLPYRIRSFTLSVPSTLLVPRWIFRATATTVEIYLGNERNRGASPAACVSWQHQRPLPNTAEGAQAHGRVAPVAHSRMGRQHRTETAKLAEAILGRKATPRAGIIAHAWGILRTGLKSTAAARVELAVPASDYVGRRTLVPSCRIHLKHGLDQLSPTEASRSTRPTHEIFADAVTPLNGIEMLKSPHSKN